MTLPARRHRTTRALVALGIAALGATTLLAPPAAEADNAATLTVVGTSDVFDSNLVQAIIKPGFEASHPGITLNYVSRGTGAAIAYAQAGTASALIVHAAALENQFVAGGYSAEPYGRAIFWGDYVLLGPAADPAGVLTNAPHDIATAFERVAAAGAAGTANFVSRGGTPGTTVQEHAIWSLTAGLTTCDVSAANGGGRSPSTAAGACPASIAYPSWYHATGLTQGPNILAGDACNFPGGNCYVLTDRGTFNYLQATNQVHSLSILTRDNSPSARGGQPLLVNSFHAYAVSAAKFASDPNVQINSAGAQQFLDWITSPEAQSAIGEFLNASSDAPFLPSAAPAITTDPLPKAIKGGEKVTVTGQVTNVVPGTPALNGVPVQLLAAPVSDPKRTPRLVASGVTGATGGFSITYRPIRSEIYSLATGSITKVEDGTLNPIFGDILAPSTARAGRVKVTGVVTLKSAEQQGKRLHLVGALKPKTSNGKSVIKLYAGRPGDKLRKISSHDLGYGKKKFDTNFDFDLKPGKWKIQVRYVSPHALIPGKSETLRVDVS